uniref:Methionine sulfoxide reductase Aa n=1 Tax=Hucho hucho TaxID=62062 RepID=A0A4W5JWG2_9TELE
MVATTRLRLIWRHFTHSRTGDMYSKTQMPTPETALPGRSESLKVSAKHDVNGNRTVPPFPEGLQMAMFGCVRVCRSLFRSLPITSHTQKPLTHTSRQTA